MTIRERRRRRKRLRLIKRLATAGLIFSAVGGVTLATLVAGINNSLDILQKRGIPISDWDQKKRELYRLKVFGGKVYFLAAELDRSEQKTNKENEADGSEKQAAEKRTERGQGNA